MVDIVGYDKYNAVDGKPNLSSISSTFYSLVQSTNGQKMVAMAENDTIPSLENLEKDRARWLYFCPWYMNYLTSEQNNPADNLKEIYNSEYCITLDELPDLKSYPITSEPDDAPAAGDVNLDGEVRISDVILLQKYLLRQETFSKKQTQAADYDRSGAVDGKDLAALREKFS